MASPAATGLRVGIVVAPRAVPMTLGITTPTVVRVTHGSDTRVVEEHVSQWMVWYGPVDGSY